MRCRRFAFFILLVTLPLSVLAAPGNVKELVKSFKAAVKGSDHQEVMALLPSLGEIGTERAIAPIFKSLDFIAKKERCYAAAVVAVAKMPEGSGWKRVTKAARLGHNVLENIFAIDVIAKRGDADDDPVLISCLKDDKGPVRRRTVLALAHRRRKAVVTALIKHMVKRDKKPDSEHQLCAVALTRLLGKSLQMGSDYEAWWDGSLEPRGKKSAGPSEEKPWPGSTGKKRVNFRKEANLDGKPIRTLEPRTKFEAIGREGEFWKVRLQLDGIMTAGFISVNYSSLSDPAKAAEKKGPAGGEESTTFYDTPLYGNGIVFLFDCSGSMVSGNLAKGAVDELCKAVRLIPGKTKFNVVTFSRGTLHWEKKLAKASKSNKKKAQEWIRELKFSGNTRLDLGLDKAFSMKGVDHIVILTDGYPTRGFMRIPSSRIYEQVRRLNRTSQVRISTFGFREANHKLLQNLAKSTGGLYRQIPQ
jgi:hypothetical protein